MNLPYRRVFGGLCMRWATAITVAGALLPTAFARADTPHVRAALPGATASDRGIMPARHVLRLPPPDAVASLPDQPVSSPLDLRLGGAMGLESHDDCVEPGPQMRRWLQKNLRKTRTDHAHYYSRSTLRDLALSVALAAPLANTSLDHDFRDWWQDDVRSTGTDRTAVFWKVFGEGIIFIPALACLGVVGHALDDRPVFAHAGEFGDRATRAFLVGAPPMLAMQVVLGASRPGETDHNSRWRPFDASTGVSGHAFVGAVPFITAAKMTENRAARAVLYLGSAGTAWSRVNDDAHYLSQAILGWYMAYLACRAVHASEQEDAQAVALVPLAGPELSGLGLVWHR